MQQQRYHSSYLMAITFVSAMGGLLFGYDFVVIGGAKPFYEAFFQIAQNPATQGWVMSSALIGCLVGACISGALSDRYGRKPMLIIASVLFTLSAIGTGATNSLTGFILYRLLGGVGIGIASNVSPIYIAEISPSAIRGRFVSINQLTIVVGILLAQITNYLIAEPVADPAAIASSWNGQMGWRWMFWAETAPALLFFGLMSCVPESPRWLASKQKTARAKAILTKVAGEEYASAEMAQISESLQSTATQGTLKILLSKRLRPILLLGVVVAVFQQWCGINVIFNYAQEVFSAAGYTVSDILLNIVITGVTNLLFTFVGMYTVDRWGRRSLMLAGASGLTLIYAAMGLCYWLNLSGIVVLGLVVAAIACFAMTLAPVTWVLLSEIFPNQVRGVAMGISTLFLWIACFVLTYTFPILNHTLQAAGTFWLYGLICALCFLYLCVQLPETKGLSLEQIEKKILK